MTHIDFETDFDQRLVYLEALVSGQATEIADLRTMIADLLPATKLPCHQVLAPKDCERIVKMRADLFHNLNAKQGTPKWDLKLFVWFDSTTGKNGTIQPLHFWMQPAFHAYTSGDESLLAELARKIDGRDLIGCLVHRGSKAAKASGTIKHKDHVVVRLNDELLIRVDRWNVIMTEYEASKDDRKSNTPVGRWWWNKPAD
jgi:hypothetical protein